MGGSYRSRTSRGGAGGTGGCGGVIGGRSVRPPVELVVFVLLCFRIPPRFCRGEGAGGTFFTELSFAMGFTKGLDCARSSALSSGAANDDAREADRKSAAAAYAASTSLLGGQPCCLSMELLRDWSPIGRESCSQKGSTVSILILILISLMAVQP
jgi:hypothetical protein